MEWLRTHPITATLLGTLALAVIGGVFVANRLAVDPGASYGSWNLSGAGKFNPSVGGTMVFGTAPEQYSEDDLRSLLETTQGPTYASLVPQNTETTGSANGLSLQDDGTYIIDDLEALFSRLAPTAQIIKPANTDEEQTLSDVYAYVPSGIAGTSSPQKVKTRAQTDLYNYGNDAGSYIETYYENWGQDQAQILKRFFEDRTSPKKREEAQKIASALVQTGKQLQAVTSIPQTMANAHASLAQNYIDVGTALTPVLTAQDDADVIATIGTYNQTAELFAKSFIQVANIFRAYEVTFADTEPGHVFVFKNAAL